MTKNKDDVLLIGEKGTLGNTDFYNARRGGKHMLRLSVGPNFSLLEAGAGAPAGTPKSIELSAHYHAALTDLTFLRPDSKDNPESIFPDLHRRFKSEVAKFIQQVVAENCNTATPHARPIVRSPKQEWNHHDI